MDYPIGTILTVPKSFNDIDWITYESGKSISVRHQALIKALGTKNFPEIPCIPVGAIQCSIFPLSGSWVEWHSINLNEHVELKSTIHQFVERLPYGESKQYWNKYLNVGSLPPINNQFFRVSDISGLFIQGENPIMTHYPMIEAVNNFVAPIGLSSVEPSKKVKRSIWSPSGVDTEVISDYVLLADNPKHYDLDKLPTLFKTGSQKIGYPEHVTVKLYIQTRNEYYGVPETHKLIIKAM